MARDTGTPASIERWILGTKAAADSSWTLHAIGLDSSRALVGSWSKEEALTDLKAWSEFVSMCATEDAHARGVATRYELSHMRGADLKAVHRLFRNHGQDDDESNPRLDGSTQASLAQMQRHQEQTMRMVAELVRSVTISVAAQHQAMASAYQMISGLGAELAGIRAGINGSDGQSSTVMESGPVKEMLQIAVPHVVDKILAHYSGAPVDEAPKQDSPSANGAASSGSRRTRRGAANTSV